MYNRLTSGYGRVSVRAATFTRSTGECTGRWPVVFIAIYRFGVYADLKSLRDSYIHMYY